ncbi:restriction endonuclease subunit S [Bifidobacterium stellenboschense]|uniref:Restriction modification system DNA specificity domain-containing protein n=1 Tax=Bifidobacterium stellenboschense TaxID=762211 RepID=A0A087DR99_9BIFI|nr:restriction endonuclease subunit S [Bifidobacterium stellenboschense]KFI98049.1 restriction modification system DNA specificity domain-containing protein [Bifidobacterium stellenboschense]
MSDGMKSSGVSWIGEIPEDWRVEPLKFHCVMFKGLPIQKTDLTDDGRRVVSYGQVHSKLNSGTHLSDDLIRYVAPALAPVSASSRLRRGDLVFADTSEDLEGIGNAVYVDSDDLVFAGYHTVTCRPDRMIDGRYFAYLARVECWRGQLRSYAMGVKVYSITQSVLSKVSVILPPVEEQERIAAYLDAQAAGIDAAVADIERQLDVLERYKVSVIHEAVTKGLDADAPMKSSGVSWIGEIPEDWRVEPLKFHCVMFKGLPIQKTDLTDDGRRVVSYGQVHSKLNSGTHLSDDLIRYVAPALAPVSASSRLRRGDLVFADTSEDLEGIGNAVYVDSDDLVFAGYHTVTCRPDRMIDGRYFAYLARVECWRGQLRSYAMGVKVYSITQSVLSKVSVILPPVEEQERIAAYLDAKCAAIDSIIATKRRQAAILKARRQSLIYEYVTGKRRVPMEE